MTFRYLDDNAFGYCNGPDEKIVRFVHGGGGMSGVTKDAASGFYLPATLTEWSSALTVANVSRGAPSHLWIPGSVSSGAIPDVIGGKSLAPSGSPLYQQPVSGWSSTCVKANGTAANQFFNNATMEQTLTSSVLACAVVTFNQSAINRQQLFHGAADGNSFEAPAGTAKMRLRNGGGSANSTLDHAGSAVRLYWLRHDITNLINTLTSTIEKLSITYATITGTTFQLQVGISTDTAASTAFIHVTEWVGAAAEWTDAELKAVSQTLGWTFTAY